MSPEKELLRMCLILTVLAALCGVVNFAARDGMIRAIERGELIEYVISHITAIGR
jgi:hypothetical protein